MISHHKHLTLTTIFLVAGSLMPRPAFAGEVNNAGELTRDQDNVWFVGDDPVKYCIDSDPNFGFDRDGLRDLVREALADWAAFFRRYGLNQAAFGVGGTLSGSFPDGLRRKLSLTFHESTNCNRAEAPLLLTFGTTPAPITPSLAAAPNEVGAAIRTAYDHLTYRAQGYIWIKSSPTADVGEAGRAGFSWGLHRSALKHLLLHELGHVFGMRHGSVPVMRQDVADVIRDSVRWPSQESRLGRIETATDRYRYLIGETIDLCAESEEGGTFDIPEGSCGNFRLPDEILEHYSLAKSGHHKLLLRIAALDSLNLTLAPSGAPAVDFSIEADRDWKPGSARLGPGIYTSWLCDGCVSPQFFRAPLDLASDIRPFDGSIAMFGTKRAIVFDRGTFWRVFNPSAGTWWYPSGRAQGLSDR